MEVASKNKSKLHWHYLAPSDYRNKVTLSPIWVRLGGNWTSSIQLMKGKWAEPQGKAIRKSPERYEHLGPKAMTDDCGSRARVEILEIPRHPLKGSSLLNK